MKFNLSSAAATVVHGEVSAEAGVVLAAADAPASTFPTLEFTSNGTQHFEYRIVTKSGPNVRFTGVRVTPVY